MKFLQKTVLATAFAATTLLACNNAAKTTEITTSPEATEGASTENIKGLLQLNGTEKWKADAQAKEGVAKIQKLVDDFKASGATDVPRYNQLALDIKGTLAQVFENTTMTGQSREELNDYLLPIVDYINVIHSSDPNAAQLGLADLDLYLKKYDTNFE